MILHHYMPMSAIRFSEKKSRIDRQKRKPIKVLKLYHMASTNDNNLLPIFVVVAQRGFSAQVEIKIGIRCDEKI